MKTACVWLARILTIGLLCLAVWLFFQRVSGTQPELFGYRFLRVVSGSMEPALQVGDVVLCKAADPSTLREGDIVTYLGTAGEMTGMTVTHRIVAPPTVDGSGNYHFETKGDAAVASDAPISGDQILGRVIKKLTVLTVLYHFFLTPMGLAAMVLPLLILLVYELRNLYRLYKEGEEYEK